jgi:hypothetical protein
VAVSPTLSQDGDSKGGLRVPAHDLEEGVWARLRRFLLSPTELLNALGDVEGSQSQVIRAAARMVQEWEGMGASFKREWLGTLLRKVVVSSTNLVLHLNPERLTIQLGRVFKVQRTNWM